MTPSPEQLVVAILGPGRLGEPHVAALASLRTAATRGAPGRHTLAARTDRQAMIAGV